MKSFNAWSEDKGFNTNDRKISDNVLIAVTNYAGFAGVWRVGLESEATHNGQRIANSPSTEEWSQSRGREYKPSTCCWKEMADYAETL